MYYNMRMKTLKLYGTNIIKRGIEVHSKKVDYIQQTLDSLNRLQKEVLRGNLAGLCPSSRMLLRLEEILLNFTLHKVHVQSMDGTRSIQVLISQAIEAMETHLVYAENLFKCMRKVGSVV
mmetsp:Transcript_20604/g.68063  ORF Transcript_20604/g.68063 Transcript_20604/m.68063 type:complete len:120 (+) Transcript_20604:922-1281(+)